MLALDYNQAKNAVNTIFMANRPVILWSSPGIGKSSIAREIAGDYDAEYLDQRANTMEPPDVRGLMEVEKKRTVWRPPLFIPTEDEKPVILAIDELNTAHQQVQQAFYELFLDRALSGVQLGNQVKLIAMCNQTFDQTFVNQMPVALASRVAHILLKPDAKIWLEWGFKNDIDPLVLAYIKLYPERIFVFDGNEISRADAKTFPCPRTYEILSDIMAQSPASDLILPLAMSCLGESNGAEFAAFAKFAHKMPSIADILDKPGKAPLPKDPTIKIMVATALASRLCKKTIGKIMTYVSRMEADIATYCIRSGVLKDVTLIATPEFVQFSTEYNNYFK